MLIVIVKVMSPMIVCLKIKKSYESSPEISSYNEIEYKETSNVEMWCREEDTYCESTTKFSVCMTNDIAVISFSDYLGYDCNQDEEICERDLLNIDEVSALLQHGFERYASMCDSTSPLFMCASLKDDIRYDVYPCVFSPTYQHFYSFEKFQHKHEDLFEDVKTSRDVLLLS